MSAGLIVATIAVFEFPPEHSNRIDQDIHREKKVQSWLQKLTIDQVINC